MCNNITHIIIVSGITAEIVNQYSRCKHNTVHCDRGLILVSCNNQLSVLDVEKHDVAKYLQKIFLIAAYCHDLKMHRTGFLLAYAEIPSSYYAIVVLNIINVNLQFNQSTLVNSCCQI